MIKFYRKKPVTVEAVQWTGKNIDEVKEFVKGSMISFEKNFITIHTLEGDMLTSVGDYIIMGVHGDYYPCKPYIFEQTYEEVRREG